MRILMTNGRIGSLTGTEIYVLELAVEWVRRGHVVAVLAREVGPLGRWLADRGVPVVSDIAALPWMPDVIHGQHNLPTMIALGAAPDAPAIYVAHGAGLQEEQPPVHPRIRRYVGVAERMRYWLRERTGVDDAQIEIVPNAVDLERFTTVRRPEAAPRRALLFANAATDRSPWVEAVAEACAGAGLALDRSGLGFRQPTATPETLLPDYDLVFATGRSAIEALACGAAVIAVNDARCGPIVGAGNLASYREINFTPPHDAPVTAPAAVAAAIGSWNATDAASVTATVRAEMSLAAACDRIEAIYAAVAYEWEQGARPSLAEETQAFARFLQALRRRPG